MEKMFVSIVEASKKTGLSANYLRKRIHSGSISCIKSGTKYLMQLLLRTLKDDSVFASENAEKPFMDISEKGTAITDRYPNLQCAINAHSYLDVYVFLS